MSVLCSVASAPSIKDKKTDSMFRGHNVRQAATIVRQCYMTLVDWLERSLRAKRQSITENSLETVFINVYDKMDKTMKAMSISHCISKQLKTKPKNLKRKFTDIYEVIRHRFDEMYISRSKYIRLCKR